MVFHSHACALNIRISPDSPPEYFYYFFNNFLFTIYLLIGKKYAKTLPEYASSVAKTSWSFSYFMKFLYLPSCKNTIEIFPFVKAYKN